jgi:hypothetical protein
MNSQHQRWEGSFLREMRKVNRAEDEERSYRTSSNISKVFHKEASSRAKDLMVSKNNSEAVTDNIHRGRRRKAWR